MHAISMFFHVGVLENNLPVLPSCLWKSRPEWGCHSVLGNAPAESSACDIWESADLGNDVRTHSLTDCIMGGASCSGICGFWVFGTDVCEVWIFFGMRNRLMKVWLHPSIRVLQEMELGPCACRQQTISQVQTTICVPQASVLTTTSLNTLWSNHASMWKLTLDKTLLWRSFCRAYICLQNPQAELACGAAVELIFRARSAWGELFF